MGSTECQLDELWSFVRKKEAHLTLAEKVLALYGDAWVWIAFTLSVAAIFRSLPVISCHTMPAPCCTCMAYRKFSCTSRANADPSPHPSSSHLLTCTMPRSSSAGKGGAWCK